MNPVIRFLIISDFLIFAASSLTTPILALFIVEQIQGATIVHVGFAATILLIAKSLCEIPVGIWVDKSPTEKRYFTLMIFASLIQAATIFMFAFITTISELYILNALIGISMAMGYPGWRVLFNRHLDKEKAAFEWSLYDVLVSLGMAGATALGGLLQALFGFKYLFLISGTVSMLGVLVLLFIRPYLFTKNK